MDFKDKLLKRKNSPEDVNTSSESSSDHHNSDNDVIYVEESSESEPELECDVWDDDCKILDTVNTGRSSGGFHLMPTCCKDPDESPCKKIKLSPQINQYLLSANFNQVFKASWNNDEKLDLQGTKLIVDPFKVCVIENFLQNPNTLHDLWKEFDEIDWNTRCMDLYEFFQSEDLKYLTKYPVISEFYEYLKTDVAKWVADLTGYNLSHISATCSYYSNTDYLLVHDDQRGDRMVAFVLYFTGLDKWSEDKGGALQLFNRDENGQPKETVENIFPSHNQFVFFPVTNKSYHRVAEVTSLSDCRFSINGWFHSDHPPVFDQPKYEPHPDSILFNQHKSFVKAQDADLELNNWIEPKYLIGTNVVLEILEYFEVNSEISLKDFFNENCFSELKRIIQSQELEWTKIGPPNRFNYEILKEDNNVPQVLSRFLNLFKSKQFFSVLHKYTDLDLDQDEAGMKMELQKWTPGCYTLLSDYDWSEVKELDLIFYLCCGEPSDIIGGRTQYVTIDEEVQSALITLEPEENSLNLVYRDTARFTKNFSSQSRSRVFYRLVCSYRE